MDNERKTSCINTTLLGQYRWIQCMAQQTDILVVTLRECWSLPLAHPPPPPGQSVYPHAAGQHTFHSSPR